MMLMISQGMALIIVGGVLEGLGPTFIGLIIKTKHDVWC